MVDKTLTTETRRARLLEEIEDKGLWNINKTTLAKQLNISRETLYKDLKVIGEQLPIEESKTLLTNLHCHYKKCEKEAYELLASSNQHNQKVKATYLLMNLAKEIREFAEAFGLKQKIADRLDVQSVNLNIELTEEDFNKRMERYMEAVK